MSSGLRRVLLAAAVTLATLGVLVAAFWLWANQDTSTYADGFTESGFAKVKEGMTLEQVRFLLGEPLSVVPQPAREIWFYFKSQQVQQQVEFDVRGRVIRFSGDGTEQLRLNLFKGEVLRLLGPPSSKQPAWPRLLHYSAPGNAGVYRARALELGEDDRVTRIIRYTMHD